MGRRALRGEAADIQLALGRRVRRLRVAAGMSQQALADASGVARNYISQIENGHRNISLAIIVHVVSALDRRLTISLRHKKA
jgi:transcriptional regulator with XRE-family HTH domain